MLTKMPMHLFKWEHGVANSLLLPSNLDKMVRIWSEMPSIDNRNDEH